jgi:hypothetical protein
LPGEGFCLATAAVIIISWLVRDTNNSKITTNKTADITITIATKGNEGYSHSIQPTESMSQTWGRYQENPLVIASMHHQTPR